MSETLRPCPFCGITPKRFSVDEVWHPRGVRRKCPIALSTYPIALWNTRADHIGDANEMVPVCSKCGDSFETFDGICEHCKETRGNRDFDPAAALVGLAKAGFEGTVHRNSHRQLILERYESAGDETWHIYGLNDRYGESPEFEQDARAGIAWLEGNE